MKSTIKALAAAIGISLLAGCASVPMGSPEKDSAHKKFEAPAEGKAGLYLYRNTFVGQSLKKTVSVDGKVLGETANKTYFYKLLEPGKHTLTTESEFGDNSIDINAVSGKNHFVEQSIRIGVFVGGASLKEVSEEEARPEIQESKLAQ